MPHPPMLYPNKSRLAAFFIRDIHFLTGGNMKNPFIPIAAVIALLCTGNAFAQSKPKLTRVMAVVEEPESWRIKFWWTRA